MNRQPDVRARVVYLTTEQGGRQTPVFSGYRGQFHYEGEHQVGWDAVQFFPGREMVLPGESAECEIWFPVPARHAGRITPGLRFHVQEGGRIVANGIVTDVLIRPDGTAG